MSALLSNIALCYHGITENINQKSENILFIDDFKKQIQYLISLKYKFVKPFEFVSSLEKNKTNSQVATIIFDDGFLSIKSACNYLLENSIPFGIAIITQRLNKITPQDGYLSFSDVNTYVNSGVCEILSHTHNLHNFSIVEVNKTIISEPILEAPFYVPNGDYIYINPLEPSKKYWDYDYVKDNAMSFPLLGTDPKTNKVINSTIKFKASKNITINKIIVWASLHTPSGSGYNCNIQVSINDITSSQTTIKPVDYGTRTQWPEREFVFIELGKSYNLLKDITYTITFKTITSGKALFEIFALPDFSGDFSLSTTCTQKTFETDDSWPARACVILCDNTGKTATIDDFCAAVDQDFLKFNSVIQKYLASQWKVYKEYYNQEKLEALVIGGTFANGSLVSTTVRLKPKEKMVLETLRIQYCSSMGIRYPLFIELSINGKVLKTFTSNWNDYHWQEIDIEPFEIIPNGEYLLSFRTLNKSPHGMGLIRIYMNQPENTPFIELLSCIPKQLNLPTSIIYPFGAYYYINTLVTDSLGAVKKNVEDVYPKLKSVFKKHGINSGFGLLGEPLQNLNNITCTPYTIPRYVINGNNTVEKTIEDINVLIGKVNDTKF